MTDWNRLLVQLDKTIGFPNKIRSNVKKYWQGYDQSKGEHVIFLEYRVKVNPGIHPPAKPPQNLRDLHGKPATETGPMATIRELLDVKATNTADSSPSTPSVKNNKPTTGKPAARPARIPPKPPASPGGLD